MQSHLDSSIIFDSQIYEVTQQECYSFSFYHQVYKKSKLSYIGKSQLGSHFFPIIAWFRW